VGSLHAQSSSGKTQIPSSGFEQVCALVKQEAAVIKRMTFNAFIMNYYCNK
jgi:hypothetical protein